MYSLIPALLLAAWLIQPWAYAGLPGGENLARHRSTANSASTLIDDDPDLRALKLLRRTAAAPVPPPPASEAAQDPEHAPAGAAPLAPPPAPTPAPAGSLEAIICSYPWPCQEALSVKWCESRDNWHTIGAAANYGGFQINAVHAWRWPDFWTSWMDPAKNTQWAFELWSEQGWRPWSCRPR